MLWSMEEANHTVLSCFHNLKKTLFDYKSILLKAVNTVTNCFKLYYHQSHFNGADSDFISKDKSLNNSKKKESIQY